MSEGRAHAALVFDGDVTVAWCEYGRPEELPNIYHRKEYEAGLEKLPDYRITCFFVDRNYRRRGVAAVALRCSESDSAGGRRSSGGVPARHSWQESLGIFPLQRHQESLRAGRLQLRPAQGSQELRNVQDGPATLETPRRAG